MSSETASRASDVGEIIGLGRWQIQVFLFFCAAAFFSTWENVSLPFLAYETSFHCSSIGSHTNQTCSIGDSNNNDCTSWQYDTSFFKSTMISEWDLVCSRSWMSSFSQTMYMIGMLTASIVCGHAADLYGRKWTIMIGFSIEILAGFYGAFAPSVQHFYAARFLMAFGQTARFITGFILVMEICSSKHRSDFGNGIQFGGSIGYIALPGIAYLLRDFRLIQLATVIPLVFFLIGWYFLPESPRWLLLNGRVGEAESVIRSAAVTNRLPCIGIKEQIAHLAQEFRHVKKSATKSSVSVLTLLNSRKLRKRTMALYFTWFVTEFEYYGFSLSAGNLGGDTFINFLILGAVEFPAYLLAMFLLRKFGRRNPYIFIMILGGVASLTAAATLGNDPTITCVRIALAMVGKFAVTGALGMLYVYSGEIFPTVLRNVGLGSCCMMGRIGSSLSAFTKDLGETTHAAVPTAVFGSLCLIDAIIIYAFLPETSGTAMPDTISDVEDEFMAVNNDADERSRRGMKSFTVIVMASFAVSTASQSVRQPMLLPTAVYCDNEAGNLFHASGNIKINDHVLGLVKRINDVLNGVHFHVQLTVKVGDWPPGNIIAANSSDYEKAIRKKVGKLNRGSVGKRALARFYVILSGNPLFGEENRTVLSSSNNACNETDPSIAIVNIKKGLRAEADDVIVNRMTGGVLHNLGVDAGCFPEGSQLYLPPCVSDAIRDRDFSCLNKPDYRQDGDPVCGNAFRERGEECECASYDWQCRNCCDMKTCTNIVGCDPNANPPTIPPSHVATDGEEEKKDNNTIPILVISVILLLVVILIGVYLWRRRTRSKSYTLPNAARHDSMPDFTRSTMTDHASVPHGSHSGGQTTRSRDHSL